MLSNTEIGIDLGTTNIIMYCKGKGIIFNEPSVIAINNDTQEVVAVGIEAKSMLGKAPTNIEVIRPIKNGVISDYNKTTQILNLLIKRAKITSGINLRKPTVVIAAPTNSTPVDRRAIVDAIKSCGAKQVHLIENTVSAALGANLPVEEPFANMIIDIGGGTTEVAIISYWGVVACHSSDIGGDRFDEMISQYVRKRYNLLIGEQTAEQIKITIGNALINHDEEKISVRGRDLVTSLPEVITLSSTEIHLIIKDLLEQITETIHMTLEECPPELSGDIFDRGIMLTGGSVLLSGLKEWLSAEIQLPVHIAPSPLESVALGTGRALAVMDKLQKAAI